MANILRKRASTFDYTVTLTRKFRYLVASSPEFGVRVSSGCIDLREATPESIGRAVIQVFSEVSERLRELDRAGQAPPKPLRARPGGFRNPSRRNQ